MGKESEHFAAAKSLTRRKLRRNVPVVEAEQIVSNLKQRGVPVEYVLFSDEGHGFRKVPNRIRSTVSMVEFFVKYLKPGNG